MTAAPPRHPARRRAQRPRARLGRRRREREATAQPRRHVESRRRGLPILTSLAPYHSCSRSVGRSSSPSSAWVSSWPTSSSRSLPGLRNGRANRRNSRQPTGGPFGRAFFFSVETLSTIGYGNIVPNGVAPHVVMTIEALVGLLVFALGTGFCSRDFRGRPPRSCSARARRRAVPGHDGFHVPRHQRTHEPDRGDRGEGALQPHRGLGAQVRRAQARAVARHVLPAELDRRASDRREESDARLRPTPTSSPRTRNSSSCSRASTKRSLRPCTRARRTSRTKSSSVTKFVNIYNPSTSGASSASTSAD